MRQYAKLVPLLENYLGIVSPIHSVLLCIFQVTNENEIELEIFFVPIITLFVVFVYAFFGGMKKARWRGMSYCDNISKYYNFPIFSFCDFLL